MYLKKKKEMLIGLIILYVFSIVYYNSIEKFQSQSTSNGGTNRSIGNSISIGPSSSSSGPSSSIGTISKIKSNSGDKFYDYLIDRDLIIQTDDYKELMFIFNSLLEPQYLENNIYNIEDIIIYFNIVNIYQFGDAILNKLNNDKYNNFLEKITCIGSDGLVKYVDIDNINYTKLYAFAELIMVYTFSKDKVVELINVHKIYKLCDLDKNNKILINNGKYGYEYNGLLVYLNVMKINNKYYRLLELLKLDSLLNNKNKEIPLKERLYNYTDSNKKISKDLNSLLVLFDYYKILDDTRINNEEDDFELDYSILRNINLNENFWDYNPFFKMYNVKDKIVNKINEITEEDKNIFEHKLNDKYVKSTASVGDKKEYKVFEKKEDKQSNNFLETLNLNMMKNRFVEVFIEIINDFLQLYSYRCTIDCKNSGNKFYDNILYYFNNIVLILVKDGRMFYVGMFVIFLSFVLYFIEVSK